MIIKAHDRWAAAAFSSASLVALLVGGGWTGAARAQAAGPQAGQSNAASEPAASEIIVTGSRGQPRTVMNSATPIDSLSAADLAKTGKPGVISALQNLAPSFEVPARAGGGTAFVVSAGGLRSLNPDQTLVLVNGTRRHLTPLLNTANQLFSGSDPVDLDMIPSSAIGHIEVLRDGAAAQYGSDAVAGVINIILKDTEGGYINGSFGQNYDRSDGKLYQLQGVYGMKLGDAGMLNLSATYKQQGQANRAVPVDPGVQLYPRVNGQPDPREATINRLITTNYGTLPVTQVTLGDNAHYDLGGVELYAFGTFSQRSSTIPYSFQSANTVNALPQIYPNGFRSYFHIDEYDFQQAAGLRGDVSGWHYDLSLTGGMDRARERSDNNINASLGPTSPTSFYLGTLSTSLWAATLDVTRTLDLGDLGKIDISLGAQDRGESFSIDAGDPSSYAVGDYVIPAGQPFAGQHPSAGALSTPGFQPGNAGTWRRNVAAVYAEADWKPSERLYVGTALRYEHYDDSSGSSVVGKIDGRYQLTDGLALRGSVGNSFHAASLAQQHYSVTNTQFATNGSGTLVQTVFLPADAPAAKALGATPLRPEKSWNYSLGLTFKPLTRLDVTIDAYQIDLKHRVLQSGLLSGPAVNAILIANGLQPNQSISYFTNGVDTRSRGVDVVASYALDLRALGRLHINAAYSYNKTDITRINPNPPQLFSLGSSYVLLDAASQGYLTQTIPNHKLIAGATLNGPKFDVTLRETYVGSYSIINNNPTLSRTFSPTFTTDLEVGYHLTPMLELFAGANNLFNRYPSRNAVNIPTLGSEFYPRQSPIGFTGGFYYVRAQMNF